jgi:hypothetical protein
VLSPCSEEREAGFAMLPLAEHSISPDRLQRPLLRRSRFRARLSASVTLQPIVPTIGLFLSRAGHPRPPCIRRPSHFVSRLPPHDQRAICKDQYQWPGPCDESLISGSNGTATRSTREQMAEPLQGHTYSVSLSA